MSLMPIIGGGNNRNHRNTEEKQYRTPSLERTMSIAFNEGKQRKFPTLLAVDLASSAFLTPFPTGIVPVHLPVRNRHSIIRLGPPTSPLIFPHNESVPKEFSLTRPKNPLLPRTQRQEGGVVRRCDKGNLENHSTFCEMTPSVVSVMSLCYIPTVLCWQHRLCPKAHIKENYPENELKSSHTGILNPPNILRFIRCVPCPPPIVYLPQGSIHNGRGYIMGGAW